MKLTEAIIPNAEIGWVNEIPAVPQSTKVEGNVTINNMGSPGVPSYFDATFSIHAKFEHKGVKQTLLLMPHVPILGETKEVAFGEIEGKALRKLGPMFRAIADDFDRQMAEWDAEEAAT